MKRFVFLVLLVGLGVFFFTNWGSKNSHFIKRSPEKSANIDSRFAILKQKADVALTYCQQNKLNTQYAFLLDYGKHSGKHRFYVWNFEKKQAIDSGLVSHGCGSNSWGSTYTADKPVFSNVADSHASSAGKYRIGKRGYSQWGIHVNYLLHGLDKTNSAAVKREIVLHSWEAVSEQSIYPSGTPEGWGCPAVSNGFMKRIDGILQKAERPVLMWVFE